MSYSKAVRYLLSLVNYEKIPFQYGRAFDLKRMELLLVWLRHPERQFGSILIAGTKGKGSAAQFTASILAAHGHRTGLYTSPHLIDVRERIRVNGRMISRPEFTRCVAQVRRVIKGHQKELASLGPPTFFEALTLIAMLYFMKRRVRFGVFEVGMGGRLDATNALHPLVSVIAPVSFDHEEHLGRTLAKIAGEKAAIIKPNGIVVVGEQTGEAKRVIHAKAKKEHAKTFFFGSSFKVRNVRSGLWGSRFDFEMFGEKWRNLKLNCPGSFRCKTPRPH